MVGFIAKNGDCLPPLEHADEGPRQWLPAEFSPSLFRCRLDDQPDALIPGSLLETWSEELASDHRWFVNPQAFFTHDGRLPPHCDAHAWPRHHCALETNMVWIPDPGSGALQPFWLGPELHAIMSGLEPGDPAPSALTPRVRRILALAGVLGADNHVARHRQDWEEAVSRLAEQFRQKAYVPVRRLVHPFHVAALRRYYRHRVGAGALQLGDSQSSRRYVAHNESVARFFHHQLTPTVAAIAREPVKPSYVYLASYQGGAKLERHTDREQCEFSITFCLDYSPEPLRATPWPLHLQTSSGQATVFQAIGDGLLYRGRQLAHFRNPLPDKHVSTSLLFHYVRADFPGSLD